MNTFEHSDFLIDAQVRPFLRNSRVDLLAADTPQIAQGRYIVYDERSAQSEIEIVRAIVPYAERRTDVGGAAESFEKITPEEGDNFFAFSPLLGSQTTNTLRLNFNAPRNAGGALLNAERQIRAGFTNLSITPQRDAMAWWPSWFAIKVPSDTRFLITFEILPAATANAISNPFQIGAAAPGTKRVDFAGVLVAGVQMPASAYDEYVKLAQYLYQKQKQEQSNG